MMMMSEFLRFSCELYCCRQSPIQVVTTWHCSSRRVVNSAVFVFFGLTTKIVWIL